MNPNIHYYYIFCIKPIPRKIKRWVKFKWYNNFLTYFIRRYGLYRRTTNKWNTIVYYANINLTCKQRSIYYHNCKQDWKINFLDYVLHKERAV